MESTNVVAGTGHRAQTVFEAGNIASMCATTADLVTRHSDIICKLVK